MLDRLERIESLDRATTPAPVMLAELRELVAEAEAWTRAEHGDTTAAEHALDATKAALESAGRTLVA